MDERTLKQVRYFLADTQAKLNHLREEYHTIEGNKDLIQNYDCRIMRRLLGQIVRESAFLLTSLQNWE